ncbi:MAG: RIP metalloprotease RseP [Raineya sp.]|jgi:regulator of sigma E protease|nr:RIP metalloprotease RseP [Raineya sp.]
MDILVMVGQLLLGLSILVGLHEWGHYIAARMFKIRVEKFYIFFDFLFPMANVWNFALWKKKIGDTEFGLGWFPLGGYVKIAGMMDESMDKEALAKPAESWEFRSKPAWQRLIVMLGGIIVNLILGMLIFIGVTYYYGDKYLPMSAAKNGIVANEVGKKIGLQTGDKIIDINGVRPEKYADLFGADVIYGKNPYYTIEREGKTMKINLPNDLGNHLAEAKKGKKDLFVSTQPRTTFKVAEVVEKQNASKAGIQKGDSIIAVNGKKITFFDEFAQELKNNKLKAVEIELVRNQEVKKVKCDVTDEGKIGIKTSHPELEKSKKTVEYSLVESIPLGSYRAFEVIFLQLKAFGKIFSGDIDAGKSLGSFGSIAEAYGALWNWENFWRLTGMLSMVLAFMNFLPIPALDGGHVVFLLYEMIRRKPAPEKVLEVAQQIGMIILLGLMAFAIISDIFLK